MNNHHRDNPHWNTLFVRDHLADYHHHRDNPHGWTNNGTDTDHLADYRRKPKGPKWTCPCNKCIPTTKPTKATTPTLNILHLNGKKYQLTEIK